MRIILKNLLTTLRRYPTAVLLNVAGLTVAFAAFIIILTQVCYEYSFDRNIPHAEQVFRVELGMDGEFGTIFSQPLIDELASTSAHIRSGSLYLVGMSPNLDNNFRLNRPNGTSDYFRFQIAQVTPPIVDILGLELLEGDSTALRHDNQVFLPLSLARRMFGDNPAVGNTLVSGSRTVSVGGVYRDFPANSVFSNAVLQGHPWKDVRGNYNYLFLVRLDNPAAVGDVRDAMIRRCRNYFGVGKDDSETAVTVRLVNVRDIYFENDVAYESLGPKGNRTTTKILLAIAVLVIVIASINFVNFASALTPVRMKMINLQKILGANVWLLRASLLLEAVAMSLVAYLVAVCVVWTAAGTRLAEYVPADMSFAANWALWGWCALIAVGVGLAAGLYPAFYMTSFRPILAVKGTFGNSSVGRRYRMTLVGLQYVISLSLIIATLFINLQNRYLTHLQMGYDKDQIIVVDLNSDVWAKRDALIADLKSYAGIEEVAFAFQKFGAEEANYMTWARPYKDFKDGIEYKALLVSDNFLRVLGIPVAQGRDFLPSDVQREPGAYIFNAVARERFSLQLGEYLGERPDPAWGEVAGFISGDTRIFSQHFPEQPFAFVVQGQYRWSSPLHFCYIRVKAGADLMAAADHIRKSIRSISPFDHDIEFMDSVVNSLYATELKSGMLVTLFSALAILVSLMGVFGLVLFETQRRRKEIGIRKVNGASSMSILGMFNRRFAAIVLGSFVIAAPLAWYGVSEWLRNFQSAVPLYGWVFAVALLIVLAITALTVTVRSWRTANENPVKSVKTE